MFVWENPALSTWEILTSLHVFIWTGVQFFQSKATDSLSCACQFWHLRRVAPSRQQGRCPQSGGQRGAMAPPPRWQRLLRWMLTHTHMLWSSRIGFLAYTFGTVCFLRCLLAFAREWRMVRKGIRTWTLRLINKVFVAGGPDTYLTSQYDTKDYEHRGDHKI